MKLYHASLNLDYIPMFYPRVPEDRHFAEDNSIPRICLSSSIEGCLSAAPWGGSNFDIRIDIGNNSSKLIRIYEFDTKFIKKRNILTPTYLYKNDLVRDAVINNEYWVINQNIEPSDSYLIKVTCYDNNYVEDDVEYKYVKMYEDNLIDTLEDYVEGAFTVIKDVEYVIVPDERRSRLIFLNHKLIGEDSGYLNKDSVLGHLMEPFIYSNMTNLDLEEREDGTYVVGVLDSRFDGELDKEDINAYLNTIIPYGYRLDI